MSDEVYTGGCLCGAVRYEARGAPWNVRYCHCRLCQKAMGSPYFARALFPGDAVTITGEVAEFNSSPALRRVFCPVCGTRLAARSDNAPARVGIALATLDVSQALAPTEHIFTDYGISWAQTDDGLPHWPERAPG